MWWRSCSQAQKKGVADRDHPPSVSTEDGAGEQSDAGEANQVAQGIRPARSTGHRRHRESRGRDQTGSGEVQEPKGWDSALTAYST